MRCWYCQWRVWWRAGYKGDASDADDDDAAAATPTGNSSSIRFPALQAALLDFWLILRQESDKVHVFFQTRFVHFELLHHLGSFPIFTIYIYTVSEKHPPFIKSKTESVIDWFLTIFGMWHVRKFAVNTYLFYDDSIDLH